MNNSEKIHYLGCKLPLEMEALKIFGVDAEAFLQSQSTINIKKLGFHSARLSSFLDRTGKIEHVAILMRADKDNFFAYVQPQELEKLEQRFNSYIISEEVTLERVGRPIILEYGYETKETTDFSFSLFGEKSTIKFSGLNDSIDMTSIKFWNEYWEIMTGESIFPVDLVDKKSFVESGLREITLEANKGCFLGQEVVNKILNHRGANYGPVVLITEKKCPSLKGQEVVVEGKKIGQITSGFYLNIDGSYCLAVLNREFRFEGKQLQINEANFQVRALPYFKELTNEAKGARLYDLGLDYYNKDHTDVNAVRMIERASELDPKCLDYLEVLGRIYLNNKDLSKSLQKFNEMLVIDPNSIMANTNLSVVYMQMGEIEKAEELKNKSLIKSFSQVSKKESDEEQKKRAALLSKLKMFNDVLEIDENDVLANWGKGDSYYQLGELDKAHSYFLKALEHEPLYVQAMIGLAKNFIAKKNWDSAKEWLEKGAAQASQKGPASAIQQIQTLLQSIPR